MKKACFLFAALALALSACGGKPAPAPVIEISEAGGNLEVTAGSEFKIVIESNPSAGYHWELIGSLDESVVQLVSKEYRADEPVMPGSGGKDVWVFKAVAAGTTTITLGYYPPGQVESASQVNEFTLVVR